MTSSYYLDYPRSKKLAPERTLISEVVRNKGVYPAGFHSNAYLCSFFGWNRGWKTFYDSMEAEVDDKVPYIKANTLNARVGRWLESRKGVEEPFFLWLHYMDVHEPYVPERRFIEKVDHSITLSDDEMFALFKDVLLKRDVSDPGKVELLRKLYLAHVVEVDEAARDFFGLLEKGGFLDDTVVIITSDHGDEFGEHGGLSHDGKMFRELIDVPLLIYDPVLTGGEVSEAVVSTLDVSPTIAHLFGVEHVDGFQGRSLLPLAELESRSVFGEAYYKHGTHEEKEDPKEVHYLREGSLKVTYCEQDDSWQMYDLADDPEERRNIFGSHPQAEVFKERIKPRLKRASK